MSYPGASPAYLLLRFSRLRLYVPVLLVLFWSSPPEENVSSPIKSNSFLSQIPPLNGKPVSSPSSLPPTSSSSLSSVYLTDTPPLSLLHSSSNMTTEATLYKVLYSLYRAGKGSGEESRAGSSRLFWLKWERTRSKRGTA